MNSLGSPSSSPVDAFAINYIRFVVNNLLTWVAVVKAALSFWTIRSELQLPPPALLPHEEDDRSPKESTSDDEIEGGVKVSRAASLTIDPPPVTVCMTKGRFTMCFFEDYCQEGGPEEAAAVEEEMEVLDGGCGSGEWWSAWERVLRETSGETGWYRCQDLSVLDGSVVRLWDDIRFNN